jgi:hypothetical protein
MSSTLYAAGAPKAVPATVNGKSLVVQPAPLDFAPFAEVKDIRAYRAVDKEAGTPYVLVTGNVVCHSAYPDSVITIELGMWLSRFSSIVARGTYSACIERPAPGKVVPFSILCSPVFPEQDREAWIKDGWKMVYTINLRVAPYIPKP